MSKRIDHYNELFQSINGHLVAGRDNPMQDEHYFIVKYYFRYPDGEKKEFRVNLRDDTLMLIPDEIIPAEWTQLSFHQCPNCPLRPEQIRHCPAALAIQNLVVSFSQRNSFDEVDVLVSVPERNYHKRTSTQEGLRSLLGIYMPSSGCPVLMKLRPMVRFHLPFASTQETLFRSVGNYLLAQYFRKKHKKKADWTLKHLKEIYENIHRTNVAFSKRLQFAVQADAAANSLVILDIFSQSIPFSVEKALHEIEYLYNMFWNTNDDQ